MKHFFYGAAIALTGLFAACSPSNELVDEKTNSGTEDVKGKTTFGGNQGGQGDVPVTRTSLDHPGVGATSNPFFWESDDKLWVKNVSSLQQSSSSNITGKTSYARFYFDGVFENQEYQVYYRGTSTGTDNTVVIAKEQTQETANSSKHFGASGDCGTATATRDGSGVYGFTLQHKAAYLSIIPRMTDIALGANTHLTQVKIVSDNAIAGTYNFSEGKLTGLTPTNPSNEITVTCGSTGFPLTGSTATDALANAGVYAVIAPGQHKLRLEYTITDKTKNPAVTGTVYQFLDTNDFKENTLTDIVVDLNTRIFDIAAFKYYRWDAKKEIFDGQTNRPHFTGEVGNTPLTDDTRYNASSAFSQASNALKEAPNVNETLWYLQQGDPRVDANVLYKYNGHLYSGKGLWLKKKKYISGFDKEKAPDAQDYRTHVPANENFVNCVSGRPDDPSQYFVLPAKGGVMPMGSSGAEDTQGQLSDVLTEGYYWLSTATTTETSNNNYAYALVFANNGYYVFYKGTGAYQNVSLRRFGLADWRGE